jgi:ferric-dicitrate binding protein FerR (iron transport regulator)
MRNNFRIEPKFSKSSREIWESHFEKLIETPSVNDAAKTVKELTVKRPASIVRFSRYSLYYAASFLILLMMIPLLYTRRVSASAGEHVSWRLPDGSQLTLNADSKVNYKPLLWPVSRGVSMKGEVFFKVVKGSGFTVKSDNGSVKVLGTSFNVYSRNDDFSVSCITGKVEVASSLPEEGVPFKTVLEKGEGIAFRKESVPEIIPAASVATSSSWVEKEFYFTNTPLEEVVKEISRQYGIDIEYKEPAGLYYTGNFSMKGSPEEVITIITLPFSLSYEKVENGYKIVKQ